MFWIFSIYLCSVGLILQVWVVDLYSQYLFSYGFSNFKSCQLIFLGAQLRDFFLTRSKVLFCREFWRQSKHILTAVLDFFLNSILEVKIQTSDMYEHSLLLGLQNILLLHYILTMHYKSFITLCLTHFRWWLYNMEFCNTLNLQQPVFFLTDPAIHDLISSTSNELSL